MIKKTLLIISALTLSSFILLSACNSSDSIDTSYNQRNFANQISLAFNKFRQSESLWDSELFNDSKFKLNIRLNKEQQAQAQKLAYSFEKHMDRSALLMHYLLSEINKRNLPIELVALPMVESGYNPRAVSHANAHGPWQFIRSTGKSYGLEKTRNYDEFYDFIESTEASLSFLEHLYNECNHNWDLALAAYNQGEFAIKKAIRAAQSKGIEVKSASDVNLSKGALNYINKFHLYADILRYPQKYGVKLPELANKPAFVRVNLDGKVQSMKQAAQMAQIDLKTLQYLNAGYLSDSLKTSKQRGLIVPIENARILENALRADETYDVAINN